MYQKPDFIQISVKVEDVFANYLTTGCPEDETLMWIYTIPCAGKDNYRQEYQTLTQAGMGNQCYSTYNP